jgi:hypothetical protein
LAAQRSYPIEMGMPDQQTVVKKLVAITEYHRDRHGCEKTIANNLVVIASSLDYRTIADKIGQPHACSFADRQSVRFEVFTASLNGIRVATLLT